MTQQTPVLIIGAGPAGLAVAGRLRKMGIAFEIVEQTDKVGASWHGHYDRLLLHTVKQLSHLPHLPFPADYPTYISRLDLIRYFENYCKTFDIKPQFKETVKSVKKESGKWMTKTASGKLFIADHVVVATGINRVPHYPTWAGQATYKGSISHSKTYKNPQSFKDKKTLIIGMGNTGAELALDLAEQGIDVTISVRSPITIVPRDVNGRPVQLTAKTLAKLPFGLGDWLGTQIRKLIIGDLSKYGVPLSKVHPAVQLRETGKTPVIDLGTVAYIKSGKIKIVGDIANFTPTGVTLKTGATKDYDAVILATGYRAKLEDFMDNLEGQLNKYAVPKQPIATDEAHKGLYYVGFDNYKLGGILGTIYTDSKIIAEAIQKDMG